MPLQGKVRLPADLAVAQAALVLGGLAIGETVIEALPESDAVDQTVAALCALGATVRRREGGCDVRGVGVGGAREPAEVLAVDPDGLALGLLAGVLASHRFTSVLTIGPSLRPRALAPVIAPLVRMGARCEAGIDGVAPVVLSGSDEMVPMEHLLAEPLLEAGSADAKNAILIAGLNTAGETTVLEARPGRDVTERLLGHFGAEVRVSDDATGRRRTTVTGWPELAGQTVAVPVDPGAVALVSAVAASLPGSDVTVHGVLLDERRRTFNRLLQDMGAEVAVGQTRELGSGPMADVRIRGAALHGIAVVPAQAAVLQDDYPLLAVAAACARGTTRLPGAWDGDGSTILTGCLQASGVEVSADAGGLAVRGTGEAPPGGVRLTMPRDLPGALSVLGLGLVGRAAMTIEAVDLPCCLSGLTAALTAVQARIVPA